MKHSGFDLIEAACTERLQPAAAAMPLKQRGAGQRR